MGAPQLNDALKFDLEVVKGPHAGLKLSFSKDSVTIGRGPENDVVLSNDPRVSRQHAEIKRRQNSEFVVVNLSGKNFIMVNGQVVESELLLNGTVVLIGDTEIAFNLRAVAVPTLSGNELPSVNVPAAVAPSPLPSFSPPPPNFSPPHPMPGMASASPPPPLRPRAGNSDDLLQNPKVRFYGIVGTLILVGFFLFSPSKGKKTKDPNEIRTSSISMQDAAEAEKRTQELLTVKKEKYDSVQYRRAQENFVKGFRDFKQGQYARAREAFQVVLNLDPDNDLAKRYYHLSKIKFDELVKFNMIQGNRYREKKNWRMCQSNYFNVITMLSNRMDDPSYREAKQYYDECTLNLEGRF